IERSRERSPLGDRVLHDVWPTLQRGDAITREYRIENVDRAVGASLGGAIGKAFGAHPPHGTASLRFSGSAGQSFGAFLSRGVDFHLRGEANDHVGKGMAGGQIVIVPPADDDGDPCLAGNAVLYGATGGSLYIAGTAGERFAVRNSGAVAVVEGIGEHGCEYMTGGIVVILGPVGANLAAGMTGGELFVLTSPDSNLESFIDARSMEILRLDPEAAERYRSIVVCHAQLTGSATANAALKRWEETIARTRSVVHRTEPAIAAPAEDSGPQTVVPVMQT
ncbi:MAG TPA: glutamate synthase subunit alpha, partial [Actinomycetota bacterium]